MFVAKILMNFIFLQLRANRSVKLQIHYFHSHLNRFPVNSSDYSDERRIENIKTMEETHQDWWDDHIMADYF